MGDNFGERLRAARIKQGLTQFDVAAIVMGTRDSQAAVSRWESNQVIPSMRNLVLLAETLKVTADELIGVSRIAEEA